MSNVFAYVDWITMESLRSLVNNLCVAEYFNTDYNKEFTREFAVGETVRVKNPQRFTIRTGLGYTPQSIARNYTTVTVDQIFGVDFEWDSVEAALKVERGMDAIKREYIDPAMLQIAQQIDSLAAQWAYYNTNNVVGALGTNPTSLSTYNEARARMVENACPPGPKSMIIDPGMQVAISNAVSTVFNPTGVVSDVFKEGTLGVGAGFKWHESMSLYNHTAATWAGTVELSAALADGATSAALTVTNGDTFFKGDVFTMQNVYNVNPKTRRSTGSLKQFVITSANQTISGTAATITFLPAIAGPGSQYQNVNSLPANGADLVLMPGTTSPNGKTGTQGLALHRDAFALVGVKLETPKAVEIASQTRDPKTGIAVRFVRMFDPQQSKMINRFDVLLGFGNLYPDSCAVRVQGA